jgi:DNA-binding NtrC family response regulator
VKSILFVDPDPEVRNLARRALESVSSIELCADFEKARERCLTDAPDLLITNIRLAAHNGLHLVHLLRSSSASTRCVVYATEADVGLAREIQEFGALVIWVPQMGLSLQALANAAELPERDRREPGCLDRRRRYRGGRRSTDV